MLDIKWIRENPETLDKALAKRGAQSLSSELMALDEKRREYVGKVQAAQERRNAASKEIGKAMAAKDAATADKLKAEVARRQLDARRADGAGEGGVRLLLLRAPGRSPRAPCADARRARHRHIQQR